MAAPKKETVSELPAGERRLVTVMFADVSGFTAMSERLDPEDVREVMNRCFGLLSQVVYDHGGQVDKYVGDCLMGLFGVPAAREDDAIRAVAAALKMQSVLEAFSSDLKRTRGLSVSMRIGLNTGEVVAGEVGSLQKSAFTVMGDSVNTASRIEHHAMVGRVWVGAETARSAAGRFRFKALKPVAVKGKVRPLRLHEVLGPAEGEFTGARPAAVRPSFIGRRRELSLLESALEAALSGDCTTAALVGEAGMGKTTLLGKFLQKIEGRPEGGEVRIFRVTCPPQGLGPYGVFRELAAKLPDPPEPPPEDDPRWKDRFFIGLEGALLRAAALVPMTVILEDLHFADAGSWELLGFLMNRLRGTRVLLVCAFRPAAERNAYWPGAENFVQVSLKPFTATESNDILNKTLGKNELTGPFRDRVINSSGGNPYFLTELVWSLTEREELVKKKGTWRLASPDVGLRIPTTVQAVLLSRLDQLPTGEKKALQAASILGAEFPPEEFQAVLGEPEAGRILESLVTKRLLSKSIKPGEAEDRFTFIHCLLQDASRDSLLKAERREYHRRAADWALASENHAGECAADHLYEAGDAEKALPFLNRIAADAARRFAFDQAARWDKRSLELMGDRSELAGVRRVRLLSRLGDCHIPANEVDAALGYYERCSAGLESSDPLKSQVHRKMSRILLIKGEPDRAIETLKEAVECECSGPLQPRRRAGLHYELAALYFRLGRDAEALDWLRKVETETRAMGLSPEGSPAEDLHELIAAYSFLADACTSVGGAA